MIDGPGRGDGKKLPALAAFWFEVSIYYGVQNYAVHTYRLTPQKDQFPSNEKERKEISYLGRKNFTFHLWGGFRQLAEPI